MYYLMVKTHNKTGLKYLCQTKRKDPMKYTGSGIKWKAHLKKFGVDITTEILGVFESKKELSEAGIYYSNLWDVVANNEWANLKLEEGDGGDTSNTENWKKGMAARRSYSGKNNPNYGKSGSWSGKVGPIKGKKWYNDGHSEIFSENCPTGFLQGRLLYTCKYCKTECNQVNIKRWHDEYCKDNPNRKYKKSHLTGKTWWNNGQEQRKFLAPPDNTWSKGRIDIRGNNNPMRKQK